MLNQIIFLSIVASIGVISGSICAPALPGISEYFAADITRVQFAISLFLIGGAIGQMISGPLSDLFNRKIVMMAGLILFVGASLICAFASTLENLLIGRFFQGMGTAAGPVLARAIAASHFPERRSAEIMSYGAFGVGLTSILAIVFSSYLTMSSWRGNFILAATLGGLLIIWAIPVFRSMDATGTKDNRSLKDIYSFLKSAFRSPPFLINTLIHSMTYGLMYGYITLFPFMIKNLYQGNDPQLVGILSACMIGVYLIGVFVGARMVAKVGLDFLVKGSLVIQLLSGIFLIFSQGSFMLFTGLFLFNLSIGVILPMTSAGALSPFGKNIAGTASSALGLVYRMLGSLLTSVICLLPVGLGGFLGGSIVLFSFLSSLVYKLLNKKEVYDETRSY